MRTFLTEVWQLPRTTVEIQGRIRWVSSGAMKTYKMKNLYVVTFLCVLRFPLYLLCRQVRGLFTYLILATHQSRPTSNGTVRRVAERLKSPRYKSQFAPLPSPIRFPKKHTCTAISCHMFSWAPLLVMGRGTVYRLYPPLGDPDCTDWARLSLVWTSGWIVSYYELKIERRNTNTWTGHLCILRVVCSQSWLLRLLWPCLWRTHQPLLVACSWAHHVQCCRPGVQGSPRLCIVVHWPVHLRCRPCKSPRASLFLQRLPIVQHLIHRSTVGSQASSVAGPQVWNCLPPEVTSAPSLATFCTRLKTFMFTESYPHIRLIWHFCL